MLSYNYLVRNPRVFQCIIGMDYKKFQRLSWRFYKRVLKVRKQRPQQRSYGGGRKSKRFQHTNDLLIFLLFYVRVYPTFDLAQALFELDRSNLCRWIQFGLPILEETLGYKLILPVEQTKDIPNLFKKFPEMKFHLVDATEQPRSRPKYNQEVFYSGKKKRHTIKRQVVCTPEGKLLGISESVPGNVHDKKLADKTGYLIHAPPGTQVLADSAYLKVDTYGSNVKVVTPNKRRPKQRLTAQQKSENHQISSIRVKVENVICHLKYYRIFSEKVRYRSCRYDNTISSIVGGLYNFTHVEGL